MVIIFFLPIKYNKWHILVFFVVLFKWKKDKDKDNKWRSQKISKEAKLNIKKLFRNYLKPKQLHNL